eukprot:6138640-Amphidinium_carterae.1
MSCTCVRETHEMSHRNRVCYSKQLLHFQPPSLRRNLLHFSTMRCVCARAHNTDSRCESAKSCATRR